MSFRFTENGIRKGIALVLVGTIAGSVSYGQLTNTTSGERYCTWRQGENIREKT